MYLIFDIYQTNPIWFLMEHSCSAFQSISYQNLDESFWNHPSDEIPGRRILGTGRDTHNKTTCGRGFSWCAQPGYFQAVCWLQILLHKACSNTICHRLLDSLGKHCYWKKGYPISSTLHGSLSPLPCCLPFVDTAARPALCSVGWDMGSGTVSASSPSPSLALGVTSQTRAALHSSERAAGDYWKLILA